MGLKIDITGWSALPEGGKQHTAFQDEPIGEARLGQASDEQRQDVELQQLIDWAAIASGFGPKIEVGATSESGPGRRDGCRQRMDS